MDVVTIGIDVGQQVDPTAIAVCRIQGDRFVTPYLERLPLGTSYPDVATRVQEIYQNVLKKVAREVSTKYLLGPPDAWNRAPNFVYLRIDATGVGTPVVDLLRERIDAKYLCGVTFTHGDNCSVRPRSKKASVGKGFLVSRLQALIQSGRIALPETPEARALAEELIVYEIRVSEDANERFGAFKVGTHDDFVTALGLAVLLEPNKYREKRATTIRR